MKGRRAMRQKKRMVKIKRDRRRRRKGKKDRHPTGQEKGDGINQRQTWVKVSLSRLVLSCLV